MSTKFNKHIKVIKQLGLISCLLISCGVVFAAPAPAPTLQPTKPVGNGSNVIIKFVNKNIQMTFTNKNSEPAVITQINQYVNNWVACASSNSSYLIQPESTLTLFPFTIPDMSNCFTQVHLFKRYADGTYPSVLGLYDVDNVFKTPNYLSDWGAYVLTPVAFRVTYSVGKINSQIGIIKYFAYKINE